MSIDNFMNIVEQEAAEEKRWSDIIINIHEVTVKAHDEEKNVINCRGKSTKQTFRNNEILVGDKQVPFSGNAFLQYLRKLEVAPQTFFKLTDATREKVVKDRLSQIDMSNTVKLRMRKNDTGVNVVAGVVSERYAPISDEQSKEWLTRYYLSLLNQIKNNFYYVRSVVDALPVIDSQLLKTNLIHEVMNRRQYFEDLKEYGYYFIGLLKYAASNQDRVWGAKLLYEAEQWAEFEKGKCEFVLIDILIEAFLGFNGLVGFERIYNLICAENRDFIEEKYSNIKELTMRTLGIELPHKRSWI